MSLKNSESETDKAKYLFLMEKQCDIVSGSNVLN